jgi:hypothetical protein
MFWNRNKVKKEPPKITLHKIQAEFKTTDGECHTSHKTNWYNISNLLCSASDYKMINIKSNGYIKDLLGTVFPLTNVVSIKWNIVDKRTIEYYERSFPQIVFTDEEINQLI